MKYVVLLRGINVGGNNKVPMAQLKDCMQQCGYENAQTYINSGNVIFETNQSDKTVIRRTIEDCLKAHFMFTIQVVVIQSDEYQAIIKQVPKWWGKDSAWRHNLIFMLEPYDMKAVVEAIGELKPDIEYIQAGEGFLFQSNLMEKASSTRFSRITGTAVYKQMTIRNSNTAYKLLNLLAEY